MCEEESVGLPIGVPGKAPGTLLHLLVPLSSLSEDRGRARVVPVQHEQRWGRENGVGMRLRACGSSCQGAAATPTASLPTLFQRVPAMYHGYAPSEEMVLGQDL